MFTAELLSPGSAALVVTWPLNVPPLFVTGYGARWQVGWVTVKVICAPGAAL
jgi:hypothetical protein